VSRAGVPGRSPGPESRAGVPRRSRGGEPGLRDSGA